MAYLGVRTPAQALRTGGVQSTFAWISQGASTDRIVKRLSSLYPDMDEPARRELVLRLRGARKAAANVRAGRWRAADVRKYAPISYKQDKMYQYYTLMQMTSPTSGETVSLGRFIKSSRALTSAEIDRLVRESVAPYLMSPHYPGRSVWRSYPTITSVELQGVTVQR